MYAYKKTATSEKQRNKKQKECIRHDNNTCPKKILTSESFDSGLFKSFIKFHGFTVLSCGAAVLGLDVMVDGGEGTENSQQMSVAVKKKIKQAKSSFVYLLSGGFGF